MRRLRIAMLTRNFAIDGGGAERYAVALVEQLAERHEVHVFAQRIDHTHPSVRYHCLPSIPRPRWINQLLFAATSRWHTRKGFDIVHSHENGWAGNVQTVHVRPMRYNLLTATRGLRRVRRWLRVITSPRLLTYLWLERARFRPCPGRAIAIVSEPLRDDMRASYPESAPCLHVIPPGVEPIQSPQDKATARTQLGLPTEGLLLLFAANDYRRKGLDTVLEALTATPEVQLVVVGNPAQALIYRKLAHSLGLADRVHFLGRHQDMAPIYAATDVLVHPTREDTFGMVVLEAMAHGLPVIVSRAPYCGLAADLSETDALLLNDPYSAAELADALRVVLTDAALRAALNLAGRAVAARYDWTRIGERYEKLYQHTEG